jgi:hypothetical protein
MKELEACHEMENGEVLNIHKENAPFFKAVLYGDKNLTAKLSKRVSCAIKQLPVRVEFTYNYDAEDAIKAGVAKDPTLILDGEIFIEGLMQAEDITKKFEELLRIKA